MKTKTLPAALLVAVILSGCASETPYYGNFDAQPEAYRTSVRQTQAEMLTREESAKREKAKKIRVLLQKIKGDAL